MRKENWFLGSLILIAFILLFLYPAVGWKFRAMIAPAARINQDAQAVENASLKADLAKLRALQTSLPPLSAYSGIMIPAFVYSRYPFNLKNELLAAAGSGLGVEIGQTAVVASDASSSAAMLMGKVENVYQDASLVETIFDSRFQAAVRIGDSGANALLKGGNDPKLTLIPKDAKVAEGDIVYSAEAGVPYGLPLGVLKNLRLANDRLFQEADLEVPYNANDLQTVFILAPQNARQ